jgi:hypothetical protein
MVLTVLPFPFVSYPTDPPFQHPLPLPKKIYTKTNLKKKRRKKNTRIDIQLSQVPCFSNLPFCHENACKIAVPTNNGRLTGGPYSH